MNISIAKMIKSNIARMRNRYSGTIKIFKRKMKVFIKMGVYIEPRMKTKRRLKFFRETKENISLY